jgi:hypothetical protein
MPRVAILAVALLLSTTGRMPALASAPTCALRVVGDDPTGGVFEFHEMGGRLLLSTGDGLFHFNGAHLTRIEGNPTGRIYKLHDTRDGLLLRAKKGFFRYNGKQVQPVVGDPTGDIFEFHETANELLLGAEKGLFRLVDMNTVSIGGDPTGEVFEFHETSQGLLLRAENGIFRYDGKRVIHVVGSSKDEHLMFHDTIHGTLLVAGSGLYQYNRNRAIRVGGEPTSEIYEFHKIQGLTLLEARYGLFSYIDDRLARIAVVPNEEQTSFYDVREGLLIRTNNNHLLRYDEAGLHRIEGEPTGRISKVHDSAYGLILSARNGLFRIENDKVIRIGGETTGRVSLFFQTPTGLLVGAENGVFRYDQGGIVRVGGQLVGQIFGFHNVAIGLLLRSKRELLYYDGTRALRITSEPLGQIYGIYESAAGSLIGASNGLFQLILQPLTDATMDLKNASQLEHSSPSKIGILTQWEMNHPCATFADQFYLSVVAANEKDKNAEIAPAVGFQHKDGITSFQATVPVTHDGKWKFHVVSTASGSEQHVGTLSREIEFVTPGTQGFPEWFARWRGVLAAASSAFWVILNLLVFVAAGYSVSAWRLATDEFWGKALIIQSLLIRHWRGAQLWVLNLYVRERCKVAGSRNFPYLPMPLVGPEEKIEDSDAVLQRLGVVRHLWVQGPTGMGKTTMFLHLRQCQFAGSKDTAFTIFQRNNYILVPFEARRFPVAPFDERGGSGWVVACVRSVLSESGLSLEDQSLLCAMLKRGTLAIAIDGLNEVAHGKSVSAFAAEFPSAPLFVTSHEPGEPPFEVWSLPSTIGEHIAALLKLYLGEQSGSSLENLLRQSGLIHHLSSGYDVRLVIELAKADPDGTNVPRDRLGLYRAAVAAAWPKGDNRLEQLEAAAWKLMSEREPNEDKRRLRPDDDATKDLLEQLAAVQERSGRTIRLIRAAPPYYEFVHDQMNAYLAACGLVNRATIAAMIVELEETKVWQDGLEAQRTLWEFVAALLERQSLEALWVFAGDDTRRTLLGRALVERAEREGWTLTRPAGKKYFLAMSGQHAQESTTVN